MHKETPPFLVYGRAEVPGWKVPFLLHSEFVFIPPAAFGVVMQADDLRALAKEREARHGARPQPASAPLPASWASKPPPAAAGGGDLTSLTRALLATHRSIRLARSLGLAAGLVAALFFMLGLAGWRTGGVLLLAGVGLARGGGAFLHGVIPATLVETSRPPSSAELAAAASLGLYSVEGLKSSGASFSAEYSVALDSLAFACTYGKKNCLTGDMFSGELSLGKILGLVRPPVCGTPGGTLPHLGAARTLALPRLHAPLATTPAAALVVERALLRVCATVPATAVVCRSGGS